MAYWIARITLARWSCEDNDNAEVPKVLLSGNHERIRQWRLQQSLERTLTRRPELLKDLTLTDEQQALLAQIETALDKP